MTYIEKKKLEQEKHIGEYKLKKYNKKMRTEYSNLSAEKKS